MSKERAKKIKGDVICRLALPRPAYKEKLYVYGKKKLAYISSNMDWR
jgi:hypothetical protein